MNHFDSELLPAIKQLANAMLDNPKVLDRLGNTHFYTCNAIAENIVSQNIASYSETQRLLTYVAYSFIEKLYASNPHVPKMHIHSDNFILVYMDNSSNNRNSALLKELRIQWLTHIVNFTGE